MYFREYFCSFSSKSYFFYILGVSHLKWDSNGFLGALWSITYITKDNKVIQGFGKIKTGLYISSYAYSHKAYVYVIRMA